MRLLKAEAKFEARSTAGASDAESALRGIVGEDAAGGDHLGHLRREAELAVAGTGDDDDPRLHGQPDLRLERNQGRAQLGLRHVLVAIAKIVDHAQRDDVRLAGDGMVERRQQRRVAAARIGRQLHAGQLDVGSDGEEVRRLAGAVPEAIEVEGGGRFAEQRREADRERKPLATKNGWPWAKPESIMTTRIPLPRTPCA